MTLHEEKGTIPLCLKIRIEQDSPQKSMRFYYTYSIVAGGLGVIS